VKAYFFNHLQQRRLPRPALPDKADLVQWLAFLLMPLRVGQIQFKILELVELADFYLTDFHTIEIT
jgi:hypothetical protein